MLKSLQTDDWQYVIRKAHYGFQLRWATNTLKALLKSSWNTRCLSDKKNLFFVIIFGMNQYLISLYTCICIFVNIVVSNARIIPFCGASKGYRNVVWEFCDY